MVERVATASRPAKLSAFCRPTTSRPHSAPPSPPRRSRTGARDSSGWAAGVGRAAPLQTNGRARRRAPIPERSVGPPRRGRVHSQEGAADRARGGIGCKPEARVSGAAQRRLAAKEETRQAARALLATVNAPGPTRSDQRHAVIAHRDYGSVAARHSLFYIGGDGLLSSMRVCGEIAGGQRD